METLSLLASSPAVPAVPRFTRWFRELGIVDVPLVGGKNGIGEAKITSHE